MFHRPTVQGFVCIAHTFESINTLQFLILLWMEESGKLVFHKMVEKNPYYVRYELITIDQKLQTARIEVL